MSRDYDVVLSFAGEDRDYVENVAATLVKRGIRVFYDRYEEAELWGKNLYQHLSDVYSHQARYCVVFISRAYASKLWPRHELAAAQARAFSENREYILPARFDDTELPGIHATIGYIDLATRTPESFADIIAKKLRNTDRAQWMSAQTISTQSPILKRSNIWKALLIVAVGIISGIVLWQLGLARQELVHLNSARRMEAIERLYSDWDSNRMRQVRANAAKQYPTFGRDSLEMLTFFERLAVLKQSGTVPADQVNYYFQDALIFYWCSYSDAVRTNRRAAGEDALHGSLWRGFELLAQEALRGQRCPSEQDLANFRMIEIARVETEGGSSKR